VSLFLAQQALAAEGRARDVRLPFRHVKSQPERLETLGADTLGLVVRKFRRLVRVLDAAVILLKHTNVVTPNLAWPQ
jgi:hypothetical protein